MLGVFWMNKAISDTHQGFKLKSIVTGAAGFIGSHLTDFLLSNGHEVLGVDNLSTGKLENLTQALKNPSFRFEHIDLSSRTEVDLIKGEYDFIFHLGALAEIVPSIQDPDKYFEMFEDGDIHTPPDIYLSKVYEGNFYKMYEMLYNEGFIRGMQRRKIKDYIPILVTT